MGLPCWLRGHKWLYEYEHVVQNWTPDWVLKHARWLPENFGATPTGRKRCDRCGKQKP